MAIVVAVVLGLIGLGALFVAPWLGGAMLLAAVILVVGGVFLIGAQAEELADEGEPETPHMPGPES